TPRRPVGFAAGAICPRMGEGSPSPPGPRRTEPRFPGHLREVPYARCPGTPLAVSTGMPLGDQLVRGLPKSRREMLNTLYLHLRMVKLTAAAGLALIALATGCMGEITNGAAGDDTLTPEQLAAKNDFEQQALPILNGFCASCHTGMANVDFM